LDHSNFLYKFGKIIVMKKILFGLLILSTFIFSSCKKEVEGCTDPTAENYNPEATINLGCQFKGCTDKDAENYDPKANVDSGCKFARDKFIGSFTGNLVCPATGTLALLNGTTDLTIDENIAGGKNDLTILMKTTSGLTIPVKATAVKNTITLNQDLKNVTITVAGNAIQADIKVEGSVAMSADNKTISGPVTLTVVTLLTGSLKDVCNLVASRK
jgi:hypothetical protein